MLPGFRFLLAAIILSMSLLVFGLGAAALLRAAHEEFASNPSWRVAPEVVFAQPAEARKPVLALLRVDLPPAEKAQEDAPAALALAEPAAIPSPPAEPERTAALKPEDAPPAESARAETAEPESPVAESPATGIPVAGKPAASEAAPASAEVPASGNDARTAVIAAAEIPLPENQVVTAQPEPMPSPASSPANIATTKIAMLGGPAVTIEQPPSAKVSDAKPDQSATKKRQQPKHTVHRRRAGARVVAQAPAQPVDPFGRPAPAPVVRRR